MGLDEDGVRAERKVCKLNEDFKQITSIPLNEVLTRNWSFQAKLLAQAHEYNLHYEHVATAESKLPVEGAMQCEPTNQEWLAAAKAHEEALQTHWWFEDGNGELKISQANKAEKNRQWWSKPQFAESTESSDGEEGKEGKKGKGGKEAQ